MENTNIVISEQQAPNTISASNSIFNVQALGQLQAFAGLMAQSAVTVPAHLVGKPADCMAIAMQAMQWGMNPYAVAQKTHIVNGVLGYEAQLINAVITSSSAITGRFKYRYGGNWERCTKTREVTRDKTGKNGKYTVTERVRDWTDEDETGLYIEVGAILRGDTEITWGEPIYLSSVVIRNSPLWVSNPKQQIAYLGTKYWARLYCPEVILGVYDPDEIQQRQEKVINPVQNDQMIAMRDINSTVQETTSSAQDSAVNIDVMADEFRDRIETATTADQLVATRTDIEAAKATLGPVLCKELTGRLAMRYHHFNAIGKVEAVINSLPRAGEDGAGERFAEAEKVLMANKRHLGDELHDKYRITLDDMKPEYVC